MLDQLQSPDDPIVGAGRFAYPRSQWIKILHDAHAGLIINPNDEDAKEAINLAGYALGKGSDEQEQSPSLGESILGGLKGVGDTFSNVAKGGVDLAGTILQNVVHGAPENEPLKVQVGPLPLYPRQSMELGRSAIDQLTAPVSVTGKALRGEAVTPEEASRAFSGSALMLGAPFTEGTGLSRAGEALKPLSRAATKPFRALSALMDNPIARSRVLRAQEELTRTRTSATAANEARNAALHSAREAAGGSRAQSAAGLAERQSALSENLGLRNELLRRALQSGEEEGGESVAPSTETPLIRSIRGMTDAELENQPMGKSPETPFEENELPNQLGARASAADIDVYLRRLAQSLAHGYINK